MQVVGYKTEQGDDPLALLIAEDGRVRRRALRRGDELSYALEDRRCAGVIDGERHVPCGAAATPYCDRHADTWVCARCTGTCLKPEMDCHEEHALYLAAFAPRTFKVGVTRTWRLETRLREQGADRAAHLLTFPDGRVARQREAELAEQIPDSVRVPTKIAGLHRSVDERAWEEVLEAFDPIDTYRFEYGFELDRAPVPETLASGTVRGTKGRVLVLDTGNTVYAVDVRDLVGHEVKKTDDGPERQSSLGAFGSPSRRSS